MSYMNTVCHKISMFVSRFAFDHDQTWIKLLVKHFKIL